jgi:hypothetical protein
MYASTGFPRKAERPWRVSRWWSRSLHALSGGARCTALTLLLGMASVIEIWLIVGWARDVAPYLGQPTTWLRKSGRIIRGLPKLDFPLLEYITLRGGTLAEDRHVGSSRSGSSCPGGGRIDVELSVNGADSLTVRPAALPAVNSPGTASSRSPLRCYSIVIIACERN